MSLAEPINPPTVVRERPALTSGELANFELVMNWWRELAGQGTPPADRYLAEQYLEHSPNFPTGREAFTAHVAAIGGARTLRELKPYIDTPVVIGSAKGDFVFLVFELEAPDPRNPQNSFFYNTFELFRIENGLIAEHWDSTKRSARPEITADLSAAQPSQQVARGSLGSLSAAEADTLRIATIEMKDVMQYGDREAALALIADDYIQHNPAVSQGRDGLLTYLDRSASARPVQEAWLEQPLLLLVSGPYALELRERMAADPNDPASNYVWSHFDMLRIENGLVVEHWDDAVIAPRAQ
ncbi:MAG: nuclear transport factor 2 family protein [Pseudomonadales bacterium]|jgi:predicted SnoaL-like aldol condensation-catalyzing enzyme|nr:nuclear transport factor 2 family protein [Pseudomonadales bacterium]